MNGRTHREPLSALFLGAPDPVSVGIARGWQLAGHRIAAIWYPEHWTATPALENDRAMARIAPALSLHGMAEKGGVSVRPTPPLGAWPEAIAEAAVLAADVVISALFLDRIPQSMLSAYPGRIVNLHPSLLPAYRGRYPVFNMLWDRTISAYGGMTLHLVTTAFDAGDILGQTHVVFPADRKLASYNMLLVKAGAALLADLVPPFLDEGLEATPQTVIDARQGQRKPSEAVLTQGLRADDIEWLCSTIPQIAPLRIQGAPAQVRAVSFLETIGPPTGAPPQVEGATVTFDGCDGRVRIAI